jgi:hypothetical protein
MPQKGSNLHRKENRFLEMCKHKLSIARSQSSKSASQGLTVGPCCSLSAACVYKENVLDLLLRKTRMNFRRVGEHERPFTE